MVTLHVWQAYASRCKFLACLLQGDDDGDEHGDEEGAGFPTASFRPGKVVWAKVDGHEWWPAKVQSYEPAKNAALFWIS